jgi:hypothetical protein
MKNTIIFNFFKKACEEARKLLVPHSWESIEIHFEGRMYFLGDYKKRRTLYVWSGEKILRYVRNSFSPQIGVWVKPNEDYLVWFENENFHIDTGYMQIPTSVLCCVEIFTSNLFADVIIKRYTDILAEQIITKISEEGIFSIPIIPDRMLSTNRWSNIMFGGFEINNK